MSEYSILEAGISLKDYNLETMAKWNTDITDFIIAYLKDKKYSLFELFPQKHSLLYEYKNSLEKTVFDKKIIYLSNITLNTDEIKSLVKEPDFYLGHIIITTNSIESEIENIISNWNQLYRTGLEIITLNSDGRQLQLFNPKKTITHKIFEHPKCINPNQ